MIDFVSSNFRVRDVHPLGRWRKVSAPNRFVSIMKISTNRPAAVVAEVSKFLILSGVVLALMFWQLAAAPVPKG